MIAAARSLPRAANRPSRAPMSSSGSDQRVGSDAGRDARAVRHAADARGGQPGAGADQHRVHVPVVAAVELQHHRPAGGGPGEAEGGHHGLGARVHEAQPLDPGQAPGDQLRQLQRACFRGAVAPAAVCRVLHGPQHQRMRMPEDQRAEGHAEVHVVPAVHVREPAAPCGADEHRRAADPAERADRRMHAARRHGQRPREQVGRAGHGVPASRAMYDGARRAA